MTKQVKMLFGAIPDTLEEFSKLSQITQAEAMKFFIEHFWIGKWRRTGIIWWNLLDGCPQFSDAIVDYYFNRKLAFFYIRQSQQPVCLMFDEPENGAVTLFAVNDTMVDRKITYRVKDLQDDRIVGSSEITVRANSSKATAVFPEEKSATVWEMEWETAGQVCRNHYTWGLIPLDHEKYLQLIRKTGLYRI